MNKMSYVALAASMILLGGCYTGTKQGIGLATGGALGGYVGSQIGHGDGQLAATAAGALLGAMLGSSVGQSMDDLDRFQAEQALESSRTGYTKEWHNPDTGADYAMTPTHTYQTAQGPCRDYATEVRVGGRAETVYGTACRGPNGSWRIAN